MSSISRMSKLYLLLGRPGQDKSSGWNALDLGNIVVHLLSQDQREHYDLETLWTVGPEYDDKTRHLQQYGDVMTSLEELMRTDFEPGVLGDLDHEEDVQGVWAKRDLSAESLVTDTTMSTTTHPGLKETKLINK